MKERIILIFSLFLLYAGRTTAAVNIIQKPTSVVENEGEFVFTKGFTIGYSDASLEPAANYLQEILTQTTGFSFKTKAGRGKIQLSIVNPDENDEDYELVSDKKGILITAHSYRGIINGIATLRQLMPIKCRWNCCIFGGFHEFYWGSPSVTIKDSPNFHWRGLMLDPVRHFFSVEETKRLLDQMALYKLNKFHWHLSDNEGFRMEVKAYPGLTSDTVAWRMFNGHDRECLNRASKENNPSMLIPWKFFKEVEGYGELYGGFYTQDEIRDVVKYAAIRGIDIIPEIDMPGHNGAACYCYKWLSCTQDGREPPRKAKHHRVCREGL